MRLPFRKFFLKMAQGFNDEAALGSFVKKMSLKLEKSRRKGRAGWENPEEVSPEELAKQLVEQVAKGDPVDIANYCMFLHQRVPNFAPGIIREAMAKHVWAETTRQLQELRANEKG